jgi:MoxR-like ATPase
MPERIQVHDGFDDNELAQMAQVIIDAFEEASASVLEEDESEQPVGEQPVIQIAPIQELIGIDPEVYRQINAALAAGFRHLLLYGPPGTGKTTIAQRVAGEISERWKLITGSADFTSQDILGGYIPLEGG